MAKDKKPDQVLPSWRRGQHPEYGVVEHSVGNWVRQERTDRGQREGLTTEERHELGKLRREVKRLSIERELLKRAVAFG